MLHHESPARLKLLASAIAGRSVEVAAVEPGRRPWTDGATIFINTDDVPADQLRALTIQASLLGARSFDGEIVKRLTRRPAVARRYLSIEGHRALAVHERLLPAGTRALIDREMAARTHSPAESLALASARQPVPMAPAVFGEIRPKQLDQRAQRQAHSHESVPPHLPRRTGEAELRQLQDSDDDFPTVDLLSSPVGGGGAVGRLLKRLFGDQRTFGGGPPGADSPTHRSGGANRPARSIAVSTAPAPIGIRTAGARRTASPTRSGTPTGGSTVLAGARWSSGTLTRPNWPRW